MSGQTPEEVAAAAIPDSVVTVPNSGKKHHGIPTAVFFVRSVHIICEVKTKTSPGRSFSDKLGFFLSSHNTNYLIGGRPR